jgi:hypothetical protein
MLPTAPARPPPSRRQTKSLPTVHVEAAKVTPVLEPPTATVVPSEYLPQPFTKINLLTHSSRYGYCGKSSAYCGKGCNSVFGKCDNQASSKPASSTLQTSTRSSASVAVASPSSSVKVTKDGRCGNANGATGGFSCGGSAYGDCCSKYSYCGSTKVGAVAKGLSCDVY